MFGKKILSIVGLFLLGNQFSYVSADCAPTLDGDIVCTSCNGENADGFYYAEGTGSSSGTNILIKVTESVGTASCNKVTVPGYYKSENGSFYKVVQTNSIASLVTSSIGETAAGNIDSYDDSLILDGSQNKLTMGTDGNFLFTDVNQVFTSGGTSKVVLKSPDANSIVLNTEIVSDDYCVSNAQKILKRDDGYCIANSCDSLIYCANGTGVCTAVTFTTDRNVRDTTHCNPSSSANKSNCDAGYYILDAGTANANFVETEATGTLWKCNDSAGNCNVVPDASIPYGYLKNSWVSTTTPYIMCNGNGSTGTCTAITKDSIHKESNVCTGTKPGDIIENGNDYKLCVGESIDPVELAGNTATVKYFIGYADGATNIFSSKMLNGYYFMVDITADEDVILHTYEGPSNKYKYTAGDLKVVEYSDGDRLNGICKSTSFTEFTKDYKENDTVDYYKMGTPVEGPLATSEEP